MAESAEMREILTCPICTEMYTDPKILQCGHTFCLDCLERCSTDWNGTVSCPSCRELCTIPATGLRNLPTNYSVRMLTDVKRKSRNIYCDEHENRVVDLYCADCKILLCIVCCEEGHQNHNWSTTQRAADHLRNILRIDVDNLGEFIANAYSERVAITTDKYIFSQRIKTLEKAIIKSGNDMKSLIDSHTKSLLDELRSIKAVTLNGMDIDNTEFEIEMDAIRTFRTYCDGIKNDGSSVDIAHAAVDLHERAKEMLKPRVSLWPSVNIQFAANDLQHLIPSETSNLVGKLVNEGKFNKN